MTKGNQKPKVAIVKNRIDRGGVLHVVVKIIKLLNDRGIEPDIVTFRSFITPDTIRAHYNLDIRFNIREIFYDLKMPYEWHLVWYNWISRFYTKSYDLLINSNNTSFLAPRNTGITYIHYPRKDRVMSKWASIHYKGGAKNHGLQYGRDLFRLAKLLYQLDDAFLPHEKVVANSRFTRSAIERQYDINQDEISVIYPPVDARLKEFDYAKKNTGTVVSLGRFEPHKRQIEQIEIARTLPEMDFYICGFVNKQSYYEKCERRVNELELSNVHLKPNVDFKELEAILASARFFIHNLQNEPFGITAVQGIAYGCIPIVHNSGGQRETVPIEALRFENKEVAVSKLRQLSARSEADLNAISQELIDNLSNFTTERFNEQFGPILDEKLKQ